MTAVQTISQQAYDEKMSIAIGIQPIRKTVALGELNIISQGSIRIKDNLLPMNDKAFSQLAKILGVPIQFQGRVDKYFGKESTSQIVNKMKSALIKQGMSTITMVADPKRKTIIGFLKKESQYVSNSTFFGVANDIINDHNLLVRDFSIGDNGGDITINCFNDKLDFQIGDHKDEFFQGGITFSNSLDKGIIISPYMNRLTCLNGMIGDSFGETYKLTGLGAKKMEELRGNLKSLEKRNYKPFGFDARVNKAMDTKCSYAELQNAAELIMLSSGARINEISRWVPLEETDDKFTKFGIPPYTLTPDKRKNAKTGTSVWDMVNGLTHFATHDNAFNVSPGSRMTIQREAGKIIAGTYDMENIVHSPFD